MPDQFIIRVRLREAGNAFGHAALQKAACLHVSELVGESAGRSKSERSHRSKPEKFLCHCYVPLFPDPIFAEHEVVALSGGTSAFDCGSDAGMHRSGN